MGAATRFWWAVLGEERKYLSLLDARVVLSAVVAMCAGWAVMAGPGSIDAVAAPGLDRLPARGLVPVSGIALMVITGAATLSVTSEYQTGTVHATLLALPSRSLVLAAKLAVQFVLALVTGIVATLVAAVGSGVRGGRTVPIAAILPDVAVQSLRDGLAFAVVAAAGVALGVLLRRDVACWTLVLLWPTLAERLLGSLPGIGPIVGPVLPFRNTDYFLFGSSHGAPYPWGPGAALLVPSAWAVGLLAFAWFGFARSAESALGGNQK